MPDCEVERIDLENAATPEEADELEEMTAEEMAVDGYYVVARIAGHEYKQGWKFLTLWDGYGLSKATWEPMSAFIQPDGSINPIFCSYLLEDNEGQLLTRAETLSQRKKRNQPPRVGEHSEHCTNRGCALQSHAYGYQREPDGRLSGVQPTSECRPCVLWDLP